MTQHLKNIYWVLTLMISQSRAPSICDVIRIAHISTHCLTIDTTRRYYEKTLVRRVVLHVTLYIPPEYIYSVYSKLFTFTSVHLEPRYESQQRAKLGRRQPRMQRSTILHDRACRARLWVGVAATMTWTVVKSLELQWPKFQR